MKKFCYGLAIVLVLPLAGPELLARGLARRDVFFQFQAQLLSLVPGKPGYFLRGAYYFLTLRKCPLNCCFHFGTIFTHSETEVGNRVSTGVRSMIGLASIGDDTLLGEDVHILSGKFQHGTEDPTIPYQDQPGEFTRIQIGRNAWIGACSMVADHVGVNCVIGAGSIVQRAIPDNMVAMGNPARPIRKVFAGEAGAAAAADAQKTMARSTSEAGEIG